MERRHEDATVHRPEVQEALELGIGIRGLLRAGARRLRHEVVLRPGAESRHVPRHPVRTDHALDAIGPALAEWEHPLERCVGQDLAQGRPHGGKR